MKKKEKPPFTRLTKCDWCGKPAKVWTGMFVYVDKKGVVRQRGAQQCWNGNTSRAIRDFEKNNPQDVLIHSGNPVFKDQEAFARWSVEHPKLAANIVKFRFRTGTRPAGRAW